MKYFLATALALACIVPAAAAYEEDGLSEALISTDIVKNADEEEPQPFIQENDEDLAAFVMDYIRRDMTLKGAFLIEDAAEKKIMKLQLVSVEQKAKTSAGAARTVSAAFRDAADKKYIIVFHLQIGPWGGLDIFKLDLKKNGPAGKPVK